MPMQKNFSILIILIAMICGCSLVEVAIDPDKRWGKGACVVKTKEGNYHIGHMTNRTVSSEAFLAGSKKFSSFKALTKYMSKLKTTHVSCGNGAIDDPEVLEPFTESEVRAIHAINSKKQ